MLVLRSVNGSVMALPSEQSLWVHRAYYDRRRGFLAECWQLGESNGYFDQPTGISSHAIITIDMMAGKARVIHRG